MATNEILPFGATASNELTQAAYAADAQRLTGNQPGVARSQLVNKTLHQLSVIAAGVAQFMADRQALNVTDSLTPAQIAAMLADASAGRLTGVRVFTASGTYTPTAGTKAVRVKIQAGGGAGGGAPLTNAAQIGVGVGGGSGAYGEGFFTTGFSGVTMTIGAGGVAVSGANGGAGGTTSFGALMSAQGGAGGNTAGPTSPPLTIGNANAAVATGGYLQSRGNNPGAGLVVNGSVGLSGIGANSPLGQGGNPTNTAVTGDQGRGYGAGGGGAIAFFSNSASAGGAGAPGVIIVEEFA